jgi:hypothetical protein
MKNHCIVGYSPGFYDYLQSVGYREVPEQVSADEPDSPLASIDTQFVNWERVEFLDYLTNCMIGIESIDPDYRATVESLYEAIDDDDLRQLVEEGSIEDLIFNDRGYYLARLESVNAPQRIF